MKFLHKEQIFFKQEKIEYEIGTLKFNFMILLCHHHPPFLDLGRTPACKYYLSF